MNTYWECARSLDSEGIAFATVTLLEARGSAPQDAGAKAIVTHEGLAFGTVGGGKIEARCIQTAQELLRSDRRDPLLITWNLQRDIGMSCGGEATFVFEIHRRDRWKVVIFGAGHVSQALTRGLATLDCQVICVDSRPDWLAKLPSGVQRELLPEPAEYLSQTQGNEFFVVMTQGHATDLPVLDRLLKTHPNAPYVGAIGSNVKALKLKRELSERGVSVERLETLRCPIGLPLGNNHPGEIAISVIAQLIQVRDQLEREKNLHTQSPRSAPSPG